MARYDPAIAACARRALARLRRILPGATELVYDNYNALVIGFGPSEKATEAVCSIALYPRWVNLYFLQGASLSDPQQLLRGDGKQVRYMRLEDDSLLDFPPVQALLIQAWERSAGPARPPTKRKLVIRAVAARQRPRRPR
jgi:hypothetical protein